MSRCVDLKKKPRNSAKMYLVQEFLLKQLFDDAVWIIDRTGWLMHHIVLWFQISSTDIV